MPSPGPPKIDAIRCSPQSLPLGISHLKHAVDRYFYPKDLSLNQHELLLPAFVHRLNTGWPTDFRGLLLIGCNV